MATVSFDRDIIITDEKAVDTIITGLMKNELKNKQKPQRNIRKEIQRGEQLLKEMSSHLKNL